MLDAINHMLTVGEANILFGYASIATQVILALLYLTALLRHKQRPFLLLLGGAASWAAYIITAMYSTSSGLSEETATNWFRLSLLLGFLGLFLTLPGIWLLLRSYASISGGLPPRAPVEPPQTGKWGPP